MTQDDALRPYTKPTEPAREPEQPALRPFRGPTTPTRDEPRPALRPYSPLRDEPAPPSSSPVIRPNPGRSTPSPPAPNATPARPRPPETSGHTLDQAIQRFWDQQDTRTDDRTQPLRQPGTSRVFSINIPFGSKGSAISVPVGPPAELYLMTMGIDFACRIVGWRLWVSPAAALTMDVRKTTPTVPETTIIPVSQSIGVSGTSTGTYDWSLFHTDGWKRTDMECIVDDLLSFYILTNDVAEVGLLRLRLRDLTVER